jgi:hypothetical protein
VSTAKAGVARQVSAAGANRLVYAISQRLVYSQSHPRLKWHPLASGPRQGGWPIPVDYPDRRRFLDV